MKRRTFFPPLVCIAALAATPASALILSSAGNQPVADPGWPTGALAVANLASRAGWWEGPPLGGGEWHFIYCGGNAAFTEALTNFAAIHAPGLEVVLHNGPHEDQFIKTNADWTFTVWVATNWNALYGDSHALFKRTKSNSGNSVPPPLLDVYLGGNLDWEKIKVPAALRVQDQRTHASAGGASPAPDSGADGLYEVSLLPSAREVTNANGAVVRAGPKAPLKIVQAHIYAEDNSNTRFNVRLDTTDYTPDPALVNTNSPLTLRIGPHWYEYRGSGGRTGGPLNVFWFDIVGEAEAKSAAKALSAECVLRSPPGYKLFPRFIPGKSSYTTNEAVTATFQLKNLDDREVIFKRGGQQRGPRDNQYGFRARRSGANCPPGGEAVPDAGDALNFGGLWTTVALNPGGTFEDEVDLKKWFAFDKPGRYAIHGFYELAFYRPPDQENSHMPWTERWDDYAAADFVIEVE